MNLWNEQEECFLFWFSGFFGESKGVIAKNRRYFGICKELSLTKIPIIRIYIFRIHERDIVKNRQLAVAASTWLIRKFSDYCPKTEGT